MKIGVAFLKKKMLRYSLIISLIPISESPMPAFQTQKKKKSFIILNCG